MFYVQQHAHVVTKRDFTQSNYERSPWQPPKSYSEAVYQQKSNLKHCTCNALCKKKKVPCVGCNTIYTNFQVSAYKLIELQSDCAKWDGMV